MPLCIHYEAMKSVTKYALVRQNERRQDKKRSAVATVYHNRHGPKMGAAVLLSEEGQLGPHLIEYGLGSDEKILWTMYFNILLKIYCLKMYFKLYFRILYG